MTPTNQIDRFSVKTLKDSGAKYRKMNCTNPHHAHTHPEIEMWGVYYKDVWVEVTKQDGSVVVRFDEDNSTVEKFKSLKKAFEHIDQKLGDKNV